MPRPVAGGEAGMEQERGMENEERRMKSSGVRPESPPLIPFSSFANPVRDRLMELLNFA
jgi:hypothetical protein